MTTLSFIEELMTDHLDRHGCINRLNSETIGYHYTLYRMTNRVKWRKKYK